MKKDIAENECHYYQFFQSGLKSPQLKVSGGKISYHLKEGRAEMPGETVVEGKVPTSTHRVTVSVPIHDDGDDQLYTLFITGIEKSGSKYQLFTGNAKIASRNKKELDGLTQKDVGNCKHHSFS